LYSENILTMHGPMNVKLNQTVRAKYNGIFCVAD